MNQGETNIIFIHKPERVGTKNGGDFQQDPQRRNQESHGKTWHNRENYIYTES